MKKVKMHEFEVCEICGIGPAIHREFCNKTLCTECAKKAFKKYAKKLINKMLAAIPVIIIIIKIISECI